MLHNLAGATIQVANAVIYNCILQDWQDSAGLFYKLSMHNVLGTIFKLQLSCQSCFLDGYQMRHMYVKECQ